MCEGTAQAGLLRTNGAVTSRACCDFEELESRKLTRGLKDRSRNRRNLHDRLAEREQRRLDDKDALDA
jgi:hypothetical protein